MRLLLSCKKGISSSMPSFCLRGRENLLGYYSSPCILFSLSFVFFFFAFTPFFSCSPITSQVVRIDHRQFVSPGGAQVFQGWQCSSPLSDSCEHLFVDGQCISKKYCLISQHCLTCSFAFN